MTRNFKLPIVATTAAALLLVISAPAMAEPYLTTGTINVNYRDIDLSSAAGQVRLQNRIEVAIRDLCGAPVFGTRDEAEMLKQCRQEARANAVPQMRLALSSASTKFASNR